MVKAHKHSIAMMAYVHASFTTDWPRSAGWHGFHECNKHCGTCRASNTHLANLAEVEMRIKANAHIENAPVCVVHALCDWPVS
jgi:hypothetical protein